MTLANTPADSTSDTNFLDALLEEGQTQQEHAASDPLGLDDLISGLIGESLQDKQDKDRLKGIRKLTKRTNLPGTLAEKLHKEAAQLEYRAEWKMVADVVWIKRCICKLCGSETPQFYGYFRKSHSRLGKAYRYVPTTLAVPSGLPRELKTDMGDIEMCADCIPSVLMDDGWMESEMRGLAVDEEEFIEHEGQERLDNRDASGLALQLENQDELESAEAESLSQLGQEYDDRN